MLKLGTVFGERVLTGLSKFKLVAIVGVPLLIVAATVGLFVVSNGYAATSPSGQSVPVGNLNGWRQSYVQDFTTDAALGKVGSVYSADMRGYSGFNDTSKNGVYTPDRVLSVSNGMLDFNLHTENGKHLVASAIPMGYSGQTYGRYTVRFRADNVTGYKMAFLLWPSSDTWNDGEIDWPEGNLAGKMYPASAKAGSYSNGKMTFDPPYSVSSPTDATGWHTATTEWTPGSVKWYWDNTLVGQTTDPSGVPTKPMRWTLQAETSTDGKVPNNSASGHIQVDWLAAYAYDPSLKVDPPTTSTGSGSTGSGGSTGATGGSSSTGGSTTGATEKTVSVNDSDTGSGLNQFNYSGVWYTNSKLANTYKADNHFTDKTNASYSVRFNGTQVKIYSEKRDVQGIVAISIDGGAETLVDDYATSRLDQQLIYTSPVLSAGEHTINVRNTGLKNSKASGVYLTADRIDITSGDPAATLDPTVDTTPPAVATEFTAKASSATSVDLSWKAATDNVGVDHYNIVRGGIVIGTSVTTSYTDKTALPETSYTYDVVAVDVAKNESLASNLVTLKTPALPDTTAPSVPASVKATAVSTTQINLSWTASTDNTGVAKYIVLRSGVQIATTTTNSYGNTGLTAGTSYTYTVKAVDAAGNTSAASGAATVSTQSPPAEPAPVTSTASGCSVNGVVAPCIGSATTGAAGWGTPKFADEFNGSSVDSTKWATNWFGGTVMNGYSKLASNVAVTDGSLILKTASDHSGAILTSNPNNGGGIKGGFEMQVGQYAEARIYLPGNGTTIYNWPAWWTDPQSWPSGGEADIVEGLGSASSNYHSNSGANNFFVGGVWSNAYHTYGLQRLAGKNNIYWDGKLIRSYVTDDGGAPEYLILTSGGDDVSGAAADMKVDYVRVW